MCVQCKLYIYIPYIYIGKQRSAFWSFSLYIAGRRNSLKKIRCICACEGYGWMPITNAKSQVGGKFSYWKIFALCCQCIPECTVGRNTGEMRSHICIYV